MIFACISYVFYETWKAFFFLIPVIIFYMKEWLEEECHKKELAFRGQFRDSIQTMAAALRAGYSVENAIRETLNDLQSVYRGEARILKEFEQMVYKLNINRTAEQVLEEFSESVEQEDVQNFITVFSAAKKSGGDSIAIIQNSVKVISEKIETEKEIQTLLASKKMEFQIMCVIPFAIIFYLKLTFGEFLSVLYGNSTGIAVMSICLLFYMAAYRMGKKIIRIEV